MCFSFSPLRSRNSRTCSVHPSAVCLIPLLFLTHLALLFCLATNLISNPMGSPSAAIRNTDDWMVLALLSFQRKAPMQGKPFQDGPNVSSVCFEDFQIAKCWCDHWLRTGLHWKKPLGWIRKTHGWWEAGRGTSGTKFPLCCSRGSPKKPDISPASFCFHELNQHDTCHLGTSVAPQTPSRNW